MLDLVRVWHQKSLTHVVENEIQERELMKMNIKTIVAMLSLASALRASSAMANPRPLPFTYPYETLNEGATEVELYGDMTPNRVFADQGGDPTKGRLYEPRYQLQMELEHGITDRTELGFYWVMQAEPQNGGDNNLKFDGFKWRVRHRFAEAGEWPIDVAVYLELETMHDELSLEEKVLLSKRFGDLRWMANLWVEQTISRPYDAGSKAPYFIINPTMGFTYQVSAKFQPGIEYWARGYVDPSNDDPIEHRNRLIHHFVGPTVHLNFGSLWWSGGIYANLNNADNPQPGEVYGPVWFRSVLGIEL
jgi:hypothetical protein